MNTPKTPSQGFSNLLTPLPSGLLGSAMGNLVSVDTFSVVTRIRPPMGYPYLWLQVERVLLDHLLRVIPSPANHVGEVTLGHRCRMIRRLSKLLLVEAAERFDAGLNEADIDRLTGEPEARDHASQDVVVHVDVFKVGEEILRVFGQSCFSKGEQETKRERQRMNE